MSEVIERELGWEDEIEKDSDYVILPEGDYDFTVKSFERGRHGGSDRLPACNKAILTLSVLNNGGEVSLTKDLFLHSKMESMLSAFFSSIGQKKKGEKLKMNWSTVTGSTGRAHIAPKKYNDNDYNEIKKFYPKEEKQFKAGEF